MVLKKKSVTVKLDSDFFDKSFEPSRKKIEKQIGTRVSQADFTKMLFNSKINLDIKLKNLPRNNVRKTKNKR